MILAILQARLSSSRLPNKVLKSILGKPMLLHQVERLQQSKKIDKLVIATSNNVSDDAIEKMCLDNNIEVFRGDLNNVLDRFYQCAKPYSPENVVRLTGDCPVIDWQVIDNVIEYFLLEKYDYVATSLDFPDGLDCEIMTMDALKTAWDNSTLPSEKEHVTRYINQKKRFKIGSFANDQKLSFLRWTVDEAEDFVLVEAIYQNLYPKNPNFLTDDILKLLEQKPELSKINARFTRNSGLQKTLKEDEKFLNNV